MNDFFLIATKGLVHRTTLVGDGSWIGELFGVEHLLR